jgi:hypothetical protein
MTKHAWRFHPAARVELDAGAKHYAEARTGLGDAFLDAVDEKLTSASRVVVPGTPVPGIPDENVRRVLLSPRFPYQLVLVIDVDIVLAVAHLRRHPDYWRARLAAATKPAPRAGASKPSRTRRR